MILLDVHTHSAASGHGSSDTINDMARQASKLGLKILGITDHGPATAGSCTPSYFRNLHLAPKERYGIRILYGVELNILDTHGALDLSDDIIRSLDYAAAGMHLKSNLPGSLAENTASYIKAMENPHIKLICHCDDTSYPIDCKELVIAAKANHVLLEINNVSLSPTGYRGDTTQNNRQLLKYCAEYNHPIILSSDSHGTSHIGDVTYAETFTQTYSFPRELILNYDPERFLEYTGIT